MATKKKLLEAAAGSAGGAGALNVEQVFSTYLYDGNGSSQIIDNGINLGQSNSGGGVFFPDGDGDYLATASLPEFTGAFTFELWFYSYDTDRALYLIDKSDRNTNFSITTNYLTTFNQIFVRVAGTTQNPSSVGFDPDGWNHVAVVRDSSDNLSTFVNGTRVANNSSVSGSITAAPYYIGGNSSGSSVAGYEPMYGYMSSVRISDTARYSTSSTSITVPTSAFTSDSNTVLLLGQGDTPLADASSNSYSVTVNGNPRASEVGPFTASDAGEGGLVWIKSRTSTTTAFIYDTERGATKSLTPSETGAQETDVNTLTAFNSNGFSVGSSGKVNSSLNDYASWTFRKAPKFFDVVTYTGTGGSRTLNHNLGSTPGCIIVKDISNAGENWTVYHRGLNVNSDNAPETDGIYLNLTNAAIDESGFWNDTAPTSTQFTVGANLNSSFGGGANYVAYLFAHNDGDGDFGPTGDQDIIKCGSYTETTGDNFVDLGFEPQWVLLKKTNAAQDWWLIDTMRGMTADGTDALIRPNTSDAELSAGPNWEPRSKGFAIPRTSGSGDNYIYIAIRRGPMAVPTDATDVFDVFTTSNGDPAGVYGTVGPVDLNVNKKRDVAYSWRVFDRLRNDYQLQFDSTNADDARDWVDFDEMSGININSTGTTYLTSDSQVHYNWKRAPNYFDAVAYTGDGVAGRTVGHNLGVVPEMIWVKRRNANSNWSVYHSATGNDKYLVLNTTAAPVTSSTFWNNTDPTASSYTVGTANGTNNTNDTYIAYLFATLDGVSKVGSFTSDGTDMTIDCGFSNGARFVLLKRYNSTDDWWLWDSVRGIVAGNDPRLRINDNAAEATAQDNIDPDNSGFIINNNILGGSGNDFIFYAIA